MTGKNGMNGMNGIRRPARRLARRLGLDANPLRRRTDKIATWLTVQFLVAGEVHLSETARSLPDRGRL